MPYIIIALVTFTLFSINMVYAAKPEHAVLEPPIWLQTTPKLAPLTSTQELQFDAKQHQYLWLPEGHWLEINPDLLNQFIIKDRPVKFFDFELGQLALLKIKWSRMRTIAFDMKQPWESDAQLKFDISNLPDDKSTIDHYTDPLKYNDAIIETQGLVIQKMTEIIIRQMTSIRAARCDVIRIHCPTGP